MISVYLHRPHTDTTYLDVLTTACKVSGSQLERWLTVEKRKSRFSSNKPLYIFISFFYPFAHVKSQMFWPYTTYLPPLQPPQSLLRLIHPLSGVFLNLHFKLNRAGRTSQLQLACPGRNITQHRLTALVFDLCRCQISSPCALLLVFSCGSAGLCGIWSRNSFNMVFLLPCQHDLALL